MDLEREMQTMYADLFEAAAVGRRQGDEMTSVVGQTQARWQTMWTIDSGRYNVPQVARRLGVSRQNIQRMTDDLVREKLLVLLDNPDHKTSPLLQLTPEGQAQLARINAASEAIHLRMLDYISEQEIKDFRALLAKFCAAVRATSPAGSNDG